MSTVTLNTDVYQALISRIEKLETVLYGEVKLKLTELELGLSASPAVKKVTKKAVEEAKATEKKKATKAAEQSSVGKADEQPTTEVKLNTSSEPAAELTTEKSKEVLVTNTEVVKESSTAKAVFTEGMNIMEYFKSNYGRYETLILSIDTLKKGIDDRANSDKKSAKKSPEELLRSRAHNVWLAIRNSKGGVPEADQAKIKELVRLVESERDKLKGGEKLGNTVSLSGASQKNTVDLGGATAVINDDEVNKRLEPEEEN